MSWSNLNNNINDKEVVNKSTGRNNENKDSNSFQSGVVNSGREKSVELKTGIGFTKVEMVIKDNAFGLDLSKISLIILN